MTHEQTRLVLHGHSITSGFMVILVSVLSKSMGEEGMTPL